MEYKILTKDEVALLAEFEVEARRTEPEIWTEEIDTQNTERIH